MKIKQLLAAAILLPAVISCRDDITPTVQTKSEVTVSLECGDMQPSGTKSSFSWSDTQIHDYEIFLVTPDGTVEQHVFKEGSGSVSFQALTGIEYTFYALVNHGIEEDPEDMNEIETLSTGISYSDIAEYGIPMSGSTTCTLGSGTTSVTIPVERLLARIDFKVDRSSLKHADSKNGFVVKSVQIYNGADDTFDYSSPSDLTILNNGGRISLYAAENLQGTILPNNKDPWSKVPSKVSGSDMCSYLEVEASYSAQGLTSDNVIYRMYLGDDATTNFDVRRNTIYTLTLIPTEDEILGDKGSWKIESSDWDDIRIMSFEPMSIEVPALGSESATLEMYPDPFDIVLAEMDWLEDAGCVWSYDESTQTLTVTNTTGLSEEANGYIFADSWDCGCEAMLEITVAQHKFPTKLTPSVTTQNTWGGNSYGISFTYSDEYGKTSTVTPTLSSISYTGGAPSGLISYSGGKIVAADWWGKSGSWVTASPKYTAVFTYNGVSASVSGTMHGVIGFDSLDIDDTYFTVATKNPTVSSAIFTGSEDMTVTSSATATVTNTTTKDFVDSYLKVGNYTASCTVTDPTCNKTRTGTSAFSVLTNVKSISAILKVNNFSHWNSDVNDFVSCEDGGTLAELTVYTNGHDETSFTIQFANFSYVDIWGNSHSIGDETYYGAVPPTTAQTWGVMPGDDDNSEWSLNGFTFYTQLYGL